jgi:peroxiredoxin
MLDSSPKKQFDGHQCTAEFVLSPSILCKTSQEMASFHPMKPHILWLILGVVLFSGCQKSGYEVGGWASPAAKQSIGEPFADFRLASSSPSPTWIRNQDVLGKPVLLIFWATWCQPCLQKARELKTHKERLDNMGVQLLSISVDENPAGVPMVQKSLGMDWPVAIGGLALFDQLGLDALPQAFLLDAKGVVLDAYTGANPLPDELDAIEKTLQTSR